MQQICVYVFICVSVSCFISVNVRAAGLQELVFTSKREDADADIKKGRVERERECGTGTERRTQEENGRLFGNKLHLEEKRMRREKASGERKLS